MAPEFWIREIWDSQKFWPLTPTTLNRKFFGPSPTPKHLLPLPFWQNATAHREIYSYLWKTTPNIQNTTLNRNFFGPPSNLTTSCHRPFMKNYLQFSENYPKYARTTLHMQEGLLICLTHLRYVHSYLGGENPLCSSSRRKRKNTCINI